MSVNKYLPHVYVLPEDDANRQIANGFFLDHGLHRRQFYVLEEAGGWTNVLDNFCSVHVLEMEKTPTRYMILAIDLDDNLGRLELAKSRIPEHLVDRVFVLCTLSEPEKLKPDLGSFETIGLGIARDCREGTNTVWGHRLLTHNATEISRLRDLVQPILFPDV